MKSKITHTEIKGLPVEATDNTDGIVSFYASTFDDVPDKVGDIVEPYAFDKSLANWASSDKRLPIVWSHEHDKVEAYIGYATDMKTDDRGLLVTAQLDMDDATARKIYNMIASRIITSASFAYDIIDAEQNEYGGLNLKEINLLEAGPCLIPANDFAEVVGWKTNKENAMVDEKASTPTPIEVLEKAVDAQSTHDLAVAAGATCVECEHVIEESVEENAEEIVEDETKDEVKAEEEIPAEEPVSEESVDNDFSEEIIQLETDLAVMEAESLLSN